MTTPSVAFSMLGARQHYVPMIMAERAGWLNCFITDFWNPFEGAPTSTLGRLGWDLIGRAIGRYTSEIPRDKVRALTLLGVQYKWLLAHAKGRAEQYSVFERVGSRFAKEACRFLSDRQDTFYGFNSASLETLRHASSLGLLTVLDQIDPARVEYELVAEEEKRFPDLATSIPSPPQSYFARIAQEWDLASSVIVNSNWSKVALEKQGVPPEKLHVVPLAFQSHTPPQVREPWKDELRVLWLGTLCLRKGLPYALQAAERLMGAPVRFTFAGPCDVQVANLRFPPNSHYAGALTWAEAAKEYMKHDVFIFPTLSDGFGMTQVEAMGYGLPVITTPCCGEVVEHGKSGLLIPPRDVRALADAIHGFVDDRDLLPRMSELAIKRSKDFLPGVVWPHYARAIACEESFAA